MLGQHSQRFEDTEVYLAILKGVTDGNVRLLELADRGNMSDGWGSSLDDCVIFDMVLEANAGGLPIDLTLMSGDLEYLAVQNLDPADPVTVDYETEAGTPGEIELLAEEFCLLTKVANTAGTFTLTSAGAATPSCRVIIIGEAD